jgi:predicted ATPase/DNA-binding SARP family transcriptional activator
VTAVGVLGPVVLHGPTGAIRIGSLRQRRLLAALVAHRAAAVSSASLAELVWDRALPADPAGAVQTNVARLRRLLPPEVRLVTTSEGYRLLADAALVDVAAFAEHVAAAASTRDAHERMERLAGALALWRGRPYTELDHASLEPEVARLTELRAAAAEQHADALLALGRVGEAVAALEALTVAEPLREGAVGLLMRALVAAGRQGDALAAYSRLRARLADELGLDPAPELRALERQVLRQEVVPAAAAAPLTAQTGAGPPAPRPPVSSFVGREADLATAADLLTRCRVVTLCGPGGVGKTRLAVHVAAAVAGRYPDGALLVEFGDGGPADVEPALAAALKLADAAADSFLARIVEVLAVRRQLLVLDNCEHVADAVARLVEAVTRGAPGVDLLLTSREPLRVDGEHVVAVHPLAPAAAARLLSDRMRAAGQPGDKLDRADLVAELCRRLDGLPLALELAAARSVTLGLRGLLDALDPAGAQPLDVLRGGRRTASARHRSLRDVVAWSHGLLDDGQRALFERLAVFAGPVEHAAVESVCGDAGALPDLVERSLVVRQPGEPARFGMLETLRAFGRSRLALDPRTPRLRARHAAWAVRLADEIGADRRGPGEGGAIRRFDAHLADLRRAHAWLCEAGPPEELLRLSLLFGQLGYLRGRIDLLRLVEEALTAVGVPEPGVTRAAVFPPLVPRLLGLLATSGWQRGDLASAQARSVQAIELAERGPDPRAARDGHEALMNVLSFRGDLDGALRQAARARELARAAGDDETEFLSLVDLAVVSAYAGDHEAAARHEEAMSTLADHIGSPTARGFRAYVRGERRAELGDPGAADHLREAVCAAEEVDSGFVAGIARHTLLTSAARDGGDPAAALVAFGPLIDHWHGFGAWTQLWIAMRALVETLSRLGRHGEVAVLLGALAASPRAPDAFGADSARVLAVEDAARDALGPAFAARRAEGAGLGDGGAVALARRLTRA